MTVRVHWWVLLALAAMQPTSAAEPDSAARDAAARIDFGWITADEALIAAAGDSLAGTNADPWHVYLRAYAAYRLAELQLARGIAAGSAIGSCQDQAELAAKHQDAAAEATVLLAACAALAAEEEPFRAVLHRRRFRQALSRAQSLEPDNPRLLLVTLQYGTADEVAARPDPESLVEAFRRTAGTARFPDWGEAEALTMVAEMHLARDDARTARDLIEEALLLAPAYAAALDVERRIRESWSDN